ncbi:Acetylcholine receptor subunit alpha-L1, partial [Lamellibrachia satsuma]
SLSDEQRLYRRLMRHLDKAVRPVRNSSSPVVVKLGITLTQIFDLDERNQVLTTNVWLDQEWRDEKLVWDPADYGGLKKLRLPCDLIWLPDIVLYNSFDDYSGSYMRSLAMVSRDGKVFWPPIVRFRSSCKVDITFFPFDDQQCHLKLGSWAYDGLQLDVTNRSVGVDLSNYINNGEWQLLQATAVRNVMFYPCCVEPFPDVTFWLHLRRRTAHYTLNVILPCVMLSVLTLTTFFLPADSGEKVTLGLTVLLSFSVFNLLIAENMPAKSDSVPLLGIYLMVIMGLTSLSVIFSVLVLNVHHRGDRETRAPYWLRRIALHYISRVMCT